MKSDEAQVERRAEERGEMKADIKYLIVAVNSIKKTVGSLDCTANTKKIDVMWDIHTENKQYKQHTIKSVITMLVKWSGVAITAGIAGATTVFACLKIF